MRKRAAFVAIAAVLSILSACEKSNSGGGGTGALTGNWAFVYLTAKTQSTAIETYGNTTNKSISTSQYTSTNNKGVVTFTTDSMYGKGIGYSITAVTKGYFYENGMFLDSVSVPLSFSLPPFNSSVKYKLVGNDSLSFTGSSFTLPPGGNPAPASNGGHYTITGDTLRITTSITQTSTQSQAGDVMTQTDQAVETIVLHRQ